MKKTILFFKNFGISKELLTVGGILAIFLSMIVPLPSFVLDFLLLISLAVSLLILLISIYIKNPTMLTMFPTLILVLTLFRLSLNVASTKAILGHGQDGADSVSQIINAFGEFVVGGDFILGLITFIILVLINFMVITKGSTRVAEVSARFALDSMPGKQMAIDADLNAGVITDEEAQEKRKVVSQTAGFYGSMDGASKFVKGDAVAGIIITFINILGGILIGIFQHNMDVSQSVNVYTLLTIGDGLVSQIPAFVLSMAVGIMLTRSSEDDQNFSLGILQQVGKEYSTFLIVGITLIFLTGIPGFPKTSLFILSAFFIITSFLIYRKNHVKGNYIFDYLNLKLNDNPIIKELEAVFKEEKLAEQHQKNEKSVPNTEEENSVPEKIEKLINIKNLELRVGFSIAREMKNGFLLDKLKGIKKKISEDLGFIIPKIQISDDKNLKPNEYELLLKNVRIGRFKIETNKSLAFPGYGSGEIENSIKIKDPNYGLDAYWISVTQTDEALMENYTIIDTPSFIATHIMELIKKHSFEIISKDDIYDLLEDLKKYYPIVVEEALANSSYGIVLQVLRNLLKSDIPILDMVTILETISDMPSSHFPVNDITNKVRINLSRIITSRYSQDNQLNILILDQVSSENLDSKIITDNTGKTSLALSLNELEGLIRNTKEGIDILEQRSIKKYVFIAPSIKSRDELTKIFKQLELKINVFIYEEIDTSVKVEIQKTIKF
jgi:flagellar biosynthesis protein FlhA